MMWVCTLICPSNIANCGQLGVNQSSDGNGSQLYFQHNTSKICKDISGLIKVHKWHTAKQQSVLEVEHFGIESWYHSKLDGGTVDSQAWSGLNIMFSAIGITSRHRFSRLTQTAFPANQSSPMPRLLSLLPIFGAATVPTVPWPRTETTPEATPEATCLPNGIGASKRRNLVNADGESYPVARWKLIVFWKAMGNWDLCRIYAFLFRIGRFNQQNWGFNHQKLQIGELNHQRTRIWHDLTINFYE